MKNWVKDMAEELNIENGNVQIGVVIKTLNFFKKPIEGRELLVPKKIKTFFNTFFPTHLEIFKMKD